MPWCVIVITILATLLFFCKNFEPLDTFITKRKICNRIDKRCYAVSIRHDNVKQASESLANLNLYAIKFMRAFREKYLFRGEGTKYQKEMAKNLLQNYNPDMIIENIPIDENNTSYVQNKGEVFSICVRELFRNGFHKSHLLEFVFMHELAHLSTMKYGHGPDFWRNFKIILMDAYEFGLHEPVDYKLYPETYCTSLKIDYNPYFDDTLKIEFTTDQ